MRRLNIHQFSDRFFVRFMKQEDVSMIYDMTRKNVQYYEFNRKENVIEDI